MLFTSPQFALFFLALLLAYRGLPAGPRTGLLLGASLVFYFFWYPAFLLLLLLDAGANYLLLRAVQAHPGRRALTVLACVLNLSVLGTFKYAAFLSQAVAPLFSGLSLAAPPVPELVLPLGISFYSFQMLALTLDARRGRAEPVRGFREYLLFVSFFPQLIAGPIVRGPQLLPQLRVGGATTTERDQRALGLLARGFAKKVVMADFLLAPFVEQVHSLPVAATGPELLVVSWAFAFQIYFDFSGYTDIARGLALLLGFELPENFREPFFSRNPAELWRRWHITLSQWLRDYLYLPLGGNRAGAPRTFLNLFLTMLLGGLWHGAAWTFVWWGAIHGLLLALHRLWVRFAPSSSSQGPDPDAPLRWRDAPRVLLCFQAVATLFVVFRAEDLGSAWQIVGGVFERGLLEPWPVVPTLAVGLAWLTHGAEHHLRGRETALGELVRRPVPAMLAAILLGALTGLCLVAGGSTGGEFIYFQF